MNRDAPDLTTHPSLLIRLRDLQDRQAWAMFVEVYESIGAWHEWCCRNQI